MSYDINNITIIGRLVRDPESTYTKSNKHYCRFSIAVNEGKDQVSFFDVTAWEKTADSISQYMKKGSQIAISGKLRQDRWQDQHGQPKSRISINANSVQFLGGNPQTQQNPSQQMTGQQNTAQQNYNQAQSIDFDNITG